MAIEVDDPDVLPGRDIGGHLGGELPAQVGGEPGSVNGVHPPDRPARRGVAGQQVEPLLLALVNEDLAGGLEFGDRRSLGRNVIMITGFDPERVSGEDTP